MTDSNKTRDSQPTLGGIFSLSNDPPTEQQINETYREALARERAAERGKRRPVAEGVLMAAPPLIDLMLLPVMLPVAMAEVIVRAPFEALSSWVNDADSRRYAFVKGSADYEMDEVPACRRYIEKVRAEGRLLTAGEISMMENRRKIIKTAGKAGAEATSILGDMMQVAGDAAANSAVKGVVNWWRKK